MSSAIVKHRDGTRAQRAAWEASASADRERTLGAYAAARKANEKAEHEALADRDKQLASYFNTQARWYSKREYLAAEVCPRVAGSPVRNPEGEGDGTVLWWTLGIAAGVGFLATLFGGSSSAEASDAPPLAGYLPPSPQNVQARPFAPGWSNDLAAGTRIGEIERAQLTYFGSDCSTPDACQHAMSVWGVSHGGGDPTAPGATEADWQRFAYALDDAYRAANRLPAASGSLSLRRARRWS